MGQTQLKMGTAVLALILVGMLGWHAQKEASRIAVAGDSNTTASSVTTGDFAIDGQPIGLAGGSNAAETPGDTETAHTTETKAGSKSTLRIGVIGATPDRNEVTLLKELPSTSGQLRRYYIGARDRACRMLIPGASVEPPLATPLRNRAGTLGRTTVMTIGLELDQERQKRMPAVTRGQVLKYFRDNRLAIQPIVYHDSQGRPYFGTDCQAAFFSLERPTITIESEPLIVSAISRFRALGVVANGDNSLNQSNAVLGRTLAMAFVFEQSTQLGIATGDAKRLATELMFVHLPENATAKDLDLEVYITSDGARTLNRVDLGSLRPNSPTPTISADVRFDEMVLMGLYPSKPVVTNIRYRTSGVLSMDTVFELSKPSRDGPGMSLTEILDQFGKLSQRSAPAF